MQTKIKASILGILLIVGLAGCSEQSPERTYGASEVEQLLKDHPELNVPESD